MIFFFCLFLLLEAESANAYSGLSLFCAISVISCLLNEFSVSILSSSVFLILFSFLCLFLAVLYGPTVCISNLPPWATRWFCAKPQFSQSIQEDQSIHAQAMISFCVSHALTFCLQGYAIQLKASSVSTSTIYKSGRGTLASHRSDHLRRLQSSGCRGCLAL